MLYFSLYFVLLVGCTQSEEVDVNKEEKAEEKPQLNMDKETAQQDHETNASEETEESKLEKAREDLSLEQQPIDILDYSHFHYDETTDVNEHEYHVESFPEKYSNINGILTFRGGHLRNSPSFGNSKVIQKKLKKTWWMATGHSPDWGGGAGWTGQPVIIEWEPEVKEMMNLKDEYKQKNNFKEVILGSLDGNVYFLDFESGEKTRDPINIGNPIKGSVSVDPRGYPLLYVGDGVPENAEIGWRIYELIDQTMLHFQKGVDSKAFRSWGAFDSSAIVNRETDTVVLGGENGMFYKIGLNTRFDIENEQIEIQPEVFKYTYQIEGNEYQGIENSVAAYKNIAYFADNGGSLQALDIRNLQPMWALPALEDTDSTIVIEEEDDVPFLYTGTEVDNIGRDGDAYLRKIDGLTGEIIWKRNYSAFYYPGVVGGVLATPIVGENELEDVVIFTIARHQQRYAGIMVALDKETGDEVWTWEMPNYAWSSPVPIYESDGTSYIIQADSVGNIYLLKGATGEILHEINVGSNIEASPAVYENKIVLASRGGKIFGISIK